MDVDQVFLISAPGNLTALPERDLREGLFDLSHELSLQQLLADHPTLLPGRQIAPGTVEPPRFALLGTEVRIGSGSLDLLFVDQHGVLTLVETKLHENPESRRTVIGQILEYASQLVVGWREETLELEFDFALAARTLQIETSADELARRIEENLRQNVLRLIVATDRLRDDVRATIELLNADMQNIELLGLEVRCYGAQRTGPFVVTPTIVGQTIATTARKSGAQAQPWPEAALLEAAAEAPDAVSAPFLRLLRWAGERGRVGEARARGPQMQIMDTRGRRVASSWLEKGGAIYVVLKPEHYASAKARDEFAQALVDAGWLVPGDLAARDGRNLRPTLERMGTDGVDQFTALLERALGLS